MNKYNETPDQQSLKTDKKLVLHQDSDSPEKTPGRHEPSNTYKSQGLIDSSDDDDDAEYEEIKDEDLIDPDNVIEPDPRIQALLKQHGDPKPILGELKEKQQESESSNSATYQQPQ